MRLLLLSVFVVYLGGCATAELTPAGQNAKLVEPDFVDAAKCKSINTFMFSNEMKFGGAARNVVIGDIRNKIGEAGGNVGSTTFDMRGTYDPTSGSSIIPIGSRIPVKVYSCTPEFYNGLVGM